MFVLISEEQFKELQLDSLKLKTLKSNGVSNWIDYGCRCCENGNKECVFCSLNEDKYLEKTEKVSLKKIEKLMKFYEIKTNVLSKRIKDV